MARPRLWPTLGAVGLLAGCAANEAMLAGEQPMAVQAATERAQANLGCAAPKATVKSSNVVPSVGLRNMTPPRQQYVIAIEGCSQPATYVVVCDSEYGQCFATDAP